MFGAKKWWSVRVNYIDIVTLVWAWFTNVCGIVRMNIHEYSIDRCTFSSQFSVDDQRLDVWKLQSGWCERDVYVCGFRKKLVQRVFMDLHVDFGWMNRCIVRSRDLRTSLWNHLYREVVPKVDPRKVGFWNSPNPANTFRVNLFDQSSIQSPQTHRSSSY